MTRLILIRHGQTEKNISGKLHQAGDSEILNKKGRKQMEKVALRIKAMSPQVIYSSTEKRAQESAKILSQELNIPMKVIEGMQERNWGDFSGKTKNFWPKSSQFSYSHPEGNEIVILNWFK